MKIVVGTDLSDESKVATRWGFEYARNLRERDVGVDVLVAHVTGAWYPQIGTQSFLDEPDNRAKLEDKVHKWIAEQHGEDRDYELVLREGRANDELRELADEVDADWVVVGRSGHGAIARLVVGSTTQKLAHDPPANMGIIHPERFDWNGDLQLAVGVDFSDSSERAVGLACDMADQLGANLHIVHVVFPPGPIATPDGMVGYVGSEYQQLDAVRSRALTNMDELVQQHESRLEKLDWSKEILTGYPTRELISYVDDHEIDGIVMGTVGRSGLDDLLLGSVATGVVKNMNCSVFLTPPPKRG